MTGEGWSRRDWIEHRYFRTYRIAAEFGAIANGAFDARELESHMVDDGVLDFVAPWQKDNVAQKLARWIAHRFFHDDTGGPYAVNYILHPDKDVEVVRILPVDLALLAYGFDHTPFPIPPPDEEMVRTGPNTTMWKESDKVAQPLLRVLYRRTPVECAVRRTSFTEWGRSLPYRLHEPHGDGWLNWLVADYLNDLDSDALNANPHNVVVSSQDGKLRASASPSG